jgi:site-specific DNA-cytosine methylase
MGISNEFNFTVVSKTIESEIIGQSVEVPLHSAILQSIREHIERIDTPAK